MNEPNGEQKPSEPTINTGCIFAFVGLFLGVTLGAPLGAFLVSLLQYEYYVYFKPDILKDGQWALVLLATVFFGGWGGAFFGGALGIFIGLRLAKSK